MARLAQQAGFEPIGVSPEVHRTSRRWVLSLAATAIVLVAAVVIVLLRTGGLG